MSLRLTGGLLIGTGLWGLWAIFSAWCVSGFPPAVDLPAHAAQLQTLADVLRGEPAVTGHYRATFPIGYGLVTWLFFPLAYVTNGAFAARVAVWVALVLLPLAHASLARALGRSGWVAVPGAPLAFGISYWYGFVPSFFALPWTLFVWALFASLVNTSRSSRATLVLVAALSTLTMLSHLVVFAALAVGIAALAWAGTPRVRALWLASLTLAPAFLLSAARVLLFMRRAVGAERQPTEYDLAGHLNWTLRSYDTAGRVALWCAVLTALVFSVAFVLRRPRGELRPFWLFLAMVVLYVATPKSFSGAWLVFPRFAVLVGFAALLLVDIRRFPMALQALLLAFTVTALVAIGVRHVRFKEAIEGLDVVTSSPPPPGVHGGLSIEGLALPSSRIKFLEHLPQWWTARHGGVGTHFFADADHQPVRFVEGRELQALTLPGAGLEVANFSALLVFGDGPLPPQLGGFEVVQRAGKWRRLERAPQPP